MIRFSAAISVRATASRAVAGRTTAIHAQTRRIQFLAVDAIQLPFEVAMVRKVIDPVSITLGDAAALAAGQKGEAE